jgi:hypothetical protein
MKENLGILYFPSSTIGANRKLFLGMKRLKILFMPPCPPCDASVISCTLTLMSERRGRVQSAAAKARSVSRGREAKMPRRLKADSSLLRRHAPRRPAEPFPLDFGKTPSKHWTRRCLLNHRGVGSSSVEIFIHYAVFSIERQRWPKRK